MTATEREAGPPPASTRSTRPPWSLAGVLAVPALLALDLAAVPAALPSVRVDLGTSTSGLLWMQGAYLLALAVALALLAAARAALDRRMLVAGGVVVFMGGALLASTGDSSATLVAGRALQGVGSGALVLAGAWDRRTPPAALAAAALVALAAAPLLGGAVAEATDWRWLFRLELVAAAPAALLLASGPGRAQHGERPLRGRRAAALSAGLVLAVTGLIQSGPWGWGSADTLLLLAAGAALLAFAWREGLTGANAAAAAIAGCLSAALLLAPQYLELVRGLSPARSGLLTLALTLPAAALALFAGRRAARVPGRVLMAGGLGGATLGALGMTRIDPASSYALVILSLALVGAGAGAAAGALAREREGAAAGLASAAAAGAALTMAAAGALFQRAQLDERESSGSFEDALAAGVAGSAWLLATLLAAAALLAWRRR